MSRTSKWLVGLTAAKILIFLLATHFLHFKPFTGSNTTNYFIPIAERLISHGTFNDDATRDYSTVPPGYPFILSIFYRAAGGSALVALVAFQFLADLLVAWTLLELGRRFGNSRAGAAAAVIWLMFPPALAVSTWITPEPLFTALLMGGLLLICVKDRELSSSAAAFSGLLFGLATLIRGNTLIVPFVLAPFWLWRRVYRGALLFVLAFGIPVGMWTVRNYMELGDPIVSSSNFGSVFLQGSDERFYHDKDTEYPPVFQRAAQAGYSKPAVETSSNISHWLFSVGWYRYRERLEQDGILSIVFQEIRKLGYMWFLTESGAGRSQLVLLLCALAIVPLGLWELYLWITSGDPARCIPAIVVGAWIAFQMAILPLARYTVSILPVILLAACFRALVLFPRMSNKNVIQ